MNVKFEVTTEPRRSGSKVADLRCPYCVLVERLGEPRAVRCYGDKVRASWTIEFTAPRVVSVEIYDWKQSGPIEDVRDWSIGGNDPAAVELVEFILDQRVVRPSKFNGGPW